MSKPEYTKIRLDAGYPKPIKDHFIGVPDDVDACLARWNGAIYFFKKHVYYKVSDKYIYNLPLDTVSSGYPKRIADHWINLPDNLDAAFQRSTGDLYFFKGSQYYRVKDKYIHGLSQDKVDTGYPESIALKWANIPNNIDGALQRLDSDKIEFFKDASVWQVTDKYSPLEDFLGSVQVADRYPIDAKFAYDFGTYDPVNCTCAFQRRNLKIYMFCGDEYIRFTDPATTPSLTDVLIRIDEGYPKKISAGWIGVPDDPNAVFQRLNGKIYFFKGAQYYRMDDKYVTGAANDVVDPGYPQNVTLKWGGVPANVDAVYEDSNAHIWFFRGYDFYRVLDKYSFGLAADIVDDGFPQLVRRKFLKVPPSRDMMYLRISSGDIDLIRNGLLYRILGTEGIASSALVDLGYPKPINLEFELPTGIQAAFQRRNGEIYYFKGTDFYVTKDRYLADVSVRGTQKPEKDLLLDGYPKTIAGNWVGLISNLDCIFQRKNGKIYVFEGDKYYRLKDYNLDPSVRRNQVEPGYPQDIEPKWPGVPNDVDACYELWDNHIYFLKDDLIYKIQDKYVFTDNNADIVMEGYPQTIAKHLIGAPTHVDAAFNRDSSNHAIYVFKGGYVFKVKDQAAPAFDETEKDFFRLDALSMTPNPLWSIVAFLITVFAVFTAGMVVSDTTTKAKNGQNTYFYNLFFALLLTTALMVVAMMLHFEVNMSLVGRPTPLASVHVKTGVFASTYAGVLLACLVCVFNMRYHHPAAKQEKAQEKYQKSGGGSQTEVSTENNSSAGTSGLSSISGMNSSMELDLDDDDGSSSYKSDGPKRKLTKKQIWQFLIKPNFNMSLVIAVVALDVAVVGAPIGVILSNANVTVKINVIVTIMSAILATIGNLFALFTWYHMRSMVRTIATVTLGVTLYVSSLIQIANGYTYEFHTASDKPVKDLLAVVLAFAALVVMSPMILVLLKVFVNKVYMAKLAAKAKRSIKQFKELKGEHAQLEKEFKLMRMAWRMTNLCRPVDLGADYITAVFGREFSNEPGKVNAEWLEKVVQNPVAIEYMKDFLKVTMSEENLLFLCNADYYELVESEEERIKVGQLIWDIFMEPGCKFQINIPATQVALVKAQIDKNSWKPTLFKIARAECFKLILTQLGSKFAGSAFHVMCSYAISHAKTQACSAVKVYSDKKPSELKKVLANKQSRSVKVNSSMGNTVDINVPTETDDDGGDDGDHVWGVKPKMEEKVWGVKSKGDEPAQESSPEPAAQSDKQPLIAAAE